MNSQYSKNVIRDLAILHGLSDDQVQEVVKSQFRKLRITIEECDLENQHSPTIRLPKFGLFFVKPRKKKKYEKADK